MCVAGGGGWDGIVAGRSSKCALQRGRKEELQDGVANVRCKGWGGGGGLQSQN